MSLQASKAKRFLAELYRRYTEHELDFSAAAISFYLFFGAFPVVLLLTLLFRYTINPEVQAEAIDVLVKGQPFLGPVLSENIRRLSEIAPLLGIIGFIGLIWAASGTLLSVQKLLDTIYEIKETRNIWLKRALDMGLIFIIGILISAFILIFVLAASLYPALRVYPWGITLSVAGTFLLSFAITLTTYTLAPSKILPLSQVWPGALFTALLWTAGQWLFNFYVTYARFDFLYGTFALGIVLLYWLYIAVTVYLMGAEINQLFKVKVVNLP